MPNQVTMTFAGEDKPITASFDRVGAASKKMGDDVGRASDDMDNGLAKVGGSADNAERNLIGVHDVIDGTATIMQGPGKQGIVAYIQGWADLAGGIAPLAEHLSKTRIATIANAVAERSAAAGAKVYAAAQWLMNTALLANPITWIIIAIVALIAIIVLIATKTDWFSKAWRASWAWIKNAAANTWDFIKKIPGWIGSAFRAVAGFLTAPFRAAFNAIANLWNNTIGQLSWSVPTWVPVIGGNTISVPHLPTFHAGGFVPGPAGVAVPIMALGGEEIRSPAASRGGGGDEWVSVDAGALGDMLLKLVADKVRSKGGRVTQLGVKVVGGKLAL
jgi:phage-related protein